MNLTAYALLIVAIALGVAGQIFLKHGMSRQPGFRIVDLFSLVTNLSVVLGFVCYGLSTLFYVTSLGSLDLALAYPTVSLGYVLVVIFSRLLFQEKVTWGRWMAVMVICVGVAIVGFAGRNIEP
jgi:multidrug transporter EmrE-like cation transporter